jgi:hypothetical protein
LGLIDPEGGRVSANFSASDLRAFNHDSFQYMNRTVFYYLTKVTNSLPPFLSWRVRIADLSSHVSHGQTRQGLNPVVSVSEGATLGEAIKASALTHPHPHLRNDGCVALQLHIHACTYEQSCLCQQ